MKIQYGNYILQKLLMFSSEAGASEKGKLVEVIRNNINAISSTKFKQRWQTFLDNGAQNAARLGFVSDNSSPSPTKTSHYTSTTSSFPNLLHAAHQPPIIIDSRQFKVHEMSDDRKQLHQQTSFSESPQHGGDSLKVRMQKSKYSKQA